MQKLRPLSGHDEYCVHRLLEEERQREALAAHAKREREHPREITWGSIWWALKWGAFWAVVLGLVVVGAMAL